MFILRTDDLFLLSFRAISRLKRKLYLSDSSAPDSVRAGTSAILKEQSDTALISEGKFFLIFKSKAFWPLNIKDKIELLPKWSWID